MLCDHERMELSVVGGLRGDHGVEVTGQDLSEPVREMAESTGRFMTERMRRARLRTLVRDLFTGRTPRADIPWVGVRGQRGCRCRALPAGA
jgi:hypothetical protein